MRQKIAEKLEDTWFGIEHMEDLWLQMADVPIKLISEEIAKVENKPRYYHYVCRASGTVKVKDEWGTAEYYYCPCFDGDFNCGYKGCKDGVIEGVKELTDIEQHENWMLDKILSLLKE